VHGAVLLVNGRPAVRIRSPAPRSEGSFRTIATLLTSSWAGSFGCGRAMPSAASRVLTTPRPPARLATGSGAGLWAQLIADGGAALGCGRGDAGLLSLSFGVLARARSIP